MKYKLFAFVLLLSMLAGFAACGQDEETAEIPPSVPEPETAVQAPDFTPPAGAGENAAAVSDPEPTIETIEIEEEEPPALSEADYIASAEEILFAILGENAPDAETADINEVDDTITERSEIELSYPIGDDRVVITFDKETGRLNGLTDWSFNGLLKPAQFTDTESAARAWYAALPFPQDYVLQARIVTYGDDMLCYEFNRLVTLEIDGEPVEVLNSYEAVRILVHMDTGALHSAIAFYWPVFDGYSQKTAISEAEAVEIAKQSHSSSGEETMSSQIVLYQSNIPAVISNCSPEQFVNYSFPAWQVSFRWKVDNFDCEAIIYVDLYTGEILGRRGK